MTTRVIWDHAAGDESIDPYPYPYPSPDPKVYVYHDWAIEKRSPQMKPNWEDYMETHLKSMNLSGGEAVKKDVVVGEMQV